MIIPGEQYQNNVAELIETGELIIIYLYAFSGNTFV